MTIRLYNVKTRQKEDFAPIDAGDVRMYVCGPTVYDRAHLGNARAVVVFDVLFRLLRHKYGADHVNYVRNFTDVDDKINAKATETGRAIGDITDETIGWYHADMDAIGALRPTHEPRATGYIGEMIAMIEVLIVRGHAYEAQGHVLFDVRSYPDYGRLSGRSVDDMIAGARVEVAPYKRDPMDFVLWKPSDASLPGWESPWGRGRPGWHIECSAMAAALLGKTFDIHGGGADLAFPHHENELAQSSCAHPGVGFANVWMHNEMLQVEGKKMSKSLGNFFTVRDKLAQGSSGPAMRLTLLSSHYRKPLDWTVEREVDSELRIHGSLQLIAMYGDLDIARTLEPNAGILAALREDLNTHEAISAMSRLNGSHEANDLARSLEFLGILSWDELRERVERYRKVLALLPDLADKLECLRREAKETRNFTKVDDFKAKLSRAHLSVMMNPDGVNLRPEIDVSPDELEALK